MDRRKEPRIPTQQPAVVTILEGAGRSFPAKTIDISGRGLRLRVSERLNVGAAVKVVTKIEEEDAWLLGEVCYSLPSVDGGFTVGIEVDQVLRGLHELQTLNQRLLGTEAERSQDVKSAEQRRFSVFYR